MTEPTGDIRELTERLHRMERRARRRWNLATVLVVVLVAGFAMGQTPGAPAEIEAQYFGIVDETGRTRAGWGMTPDGNVSLDFYHSDGKRRLMAGILEGGAPAVAVFDEQENSRAVLSYQDGSPVLTLRGKDAQTSIDIVILESDSPMMVVREKKKVLFTAPAEGWWSLWLRKLSPEVSTDDEN